MKKVSVICFISLFIISCGTKKEAMLTRTNQSIISSENIAPYFDITENAKDDTYGLTGENPVKVGGNSPSNQRRYLASLAGPNGEALSFNRKGSCCAYENENGLMGTALIDVYAITYDGLKEPIDIYISFYDLEKLYIPKGFTRRTN